MPVYLRDVLLRHLFVLPHTDRSCRSNMVTLG